ncbi:hypothetical protein [Microbacterium sp.]|uniref:hypothetical protein n=1 Tax=Microbacterium sp. TaxID=51671 RepID=UPI003A885EB4
MRRSTTRVGGCAFLTVAAVLCTACIDAAPSTPTATRTPWTPPASIPVAADAPRTAFADADIVGWELAAPTVVAAVRPEVGSAADGDIALAIDAPVVDAPVTAASTPVLLTAGEEYTVRVDARLRTPFPEPVPVVLLVAGREIALPDLDARWRTVERTFTAPDDVADAAIEVRLDGAVTGLALDRIGVTDSGGNGVVENGSFESVDPPYGIVSESLVFAADTAAVAVSLAEGTATWRVDRDEELVAQGEVAIGDHLEAFPLEGVPQGYFELTVTDGAGTSTVAPIVVIDGDSERLGPDDRFGVGLHVERDLYRNSARYAASLGLATARNDIRWHLNETTPGRYDWLPEYDREFAALRARGVSLVGIVNYGNPLYGSKLTPDNPTAIAEYGRYAAAVAGRYDVLGLEVFNEFNQKRFNKTGCGIAPECYVPLLESVHRNVVEVDPDLPIVAGATARYDADWFDGLWRAGGLEYADAISYHPYEVSPDPDALGAIVRESERSMQDNGGGTRPVWITELGTSSKTGGRTQTQQAVYLVKTSVTAIGHGVEHFLWYDLINDEPNPAAHEGNFGLFGQPRTGVAALPPKHAAFAQALLVSQLSGREFSEHEDLGDGVFSYAFGDEGDRVRVLWAEHDVTTVAIPTTQPLTVVAFDGSERLVQPIGGVAQVEVGGQPQYVRSGDAVDRTEPLGSEAPAGAQ